MFGFNLIPPPGAFPLRRNDVPGDDLAIFSQSSLGSTDALMGTDFRQGQATDFFLNMSPGWMVDPIPVQSLSAPVPEALPAQHTLGLASKSPAFLQADLRSGFFPMSDQAFPSSTPTMAPPPPLDVSFSSDVQTDVLLSATAAAALASGLHYQAPSSELQTSPPAFTSESVTPADLWPPFSSSSASLATLDDPPPPVVQRPSNSLNVDSLYSSRGLSGCLPLSSPEVISSPPFDNSFTVPEGQLNFWQSLPSKPEFGPAVPQYTNTAFPTGKATSQRFPLKPSISPVSKDQSNLPDLAILMVSTSPTPSADTSVVSGHSSGPPDTPSIASERLTKQINTVSPGIPNREWTPASTPLAQGEEAVPHQTSSRGRKVTCGMSNDRKFGCPYCGTGFRRLEHRDRHVTSRHEPNKNRIKCEYCNYMSCRKDNLQTHMLTMHGVSKPPSSRGRRAKQSAKEPYSKVKVGRSKAARS